MLVLNHFQIVAICALCAFKPAVKLFGVPDSSRQRDDGTRRQEKQLLPDNTIFSLTNTMNLIKDDASESRRPRIGVRWGKQHDLENMGHSNQDLTSRGVVDAMVSCMNRPNRLSSDLCRVGFGEPSLHLGRNLVNECFCGSNINKNAIVVLFEDLPHCVEPKMH